MAFDFSVFDHPHRISLIRVTRGGVDQNTGKVVPNTESEVDIVGAIDVLTQERESKEDRDRSGPTPVGEAALYTSDSNVKVGDRLRVYEDAGETKSKTYYVKGEESAFFFLNQKAAPADRKKFHLVLEEGQLGGAF